MNHPDKDVIRTFLVSDAEHYLANENNYADARQWVWLMEDLAAENQQLRVAPPQKFAGTEHLPDGTPVIANQELFTTVRYWEGAVDISGTRSGEMLFGRGYVELTGYAQ